MKIRTDFVSNSSTSSFLVIGKLLDIDDVYQLISSKDNVLNALNEYFQLNYQNFDDAFNELNCYELSQFILNQQNSALKLTAETSEEMIAIGAEIEDFSETETLQEFKQRVAESLTELGIKCEGKNVAFITGGTTSAGDVFFY